MSDVQPDGSAHSLSEWLDRTKVELLAVIEQSEDPMELVYMAARLTEMEGTLDLWFSSIRTTLQQRLTHLTGRAPGQG